MSGGEDEPTFLKNPPGTGAAAKSAAKTPTPGDLLEARRRDVRELYAGTARWEHGNGWPGAWVEQKLGGLRLSVPGHWKRDAGGQSWEIPDHQAVVSVHMIGFEKSAPRVRDYLHFLEGTDRKGYERVGVRELPHPHDTAEAGTAVELFEHAPLLPAWPMRWLRIAAWSGTALLGLQLDTQNDGLVADDIGSDYARMWRSLR